MFRQGMFLKCFSVLLVVSAMGLAGCSKDQDEAELCAIDSCGSLVSAGVCNDESGKATCTCNKGYEGAHCDKCADSYSMVDGICMPPVCGDDTCMESVEGGSCDDTTGVAVCSCSKGHVGSSCANCADGYLRGMGGACIGAHIASCDTVDGIDSELVQSPQLRMTLPASWDENWFASPAVADINNDGEMEIIAARHSVLYAWDHNGKMLWRAAWSFSASEEEDHGGSRMWASPVVGDFDGDGDMEIAVGSDADSSSGVNVAVYDHNGELLKGWPTAFGTTEVRSICGGDLDGDGNVEIVVNKTATGPATAVYQLDGTMRAGWPQVNNATCDPPEPAEECWDYGGFNQNIGVGDIDGDGYLDVISTYDAISFGVFDRDGKPFAPAPEFSDGVITSVEAYHDEALSRQGWGSGDRSEFTYSPPVIADVDRDGGVEYIMASDHEHSSDTTNQGNSLWVLHSDLTRPSGFETPIDSLSLIESDDLGQNIVGTRPSPSVANINGDESLEILYPSYDGYLYAYAADGTKLWSYLFSTGAAPYTGCSEAVIADLNGDGIPEIIFTTYTSGAPREPEIPAHLVILSNTGEQLHEVEIFGRGSMAAPTIADVDGDSVLEIIVSLKDTLGGSDGGVQIWDVPGSHTNCLLWPTGRGDYLRQGYVR